MKKVPLNILITASSDGHFYSFHLPAFKALLAEGHRVSATARGNGSRLPEGVLYREVPFTKSFLSLRNFQAAAKLSAQIRQERYDLILCHTSLAAFFTRLAVLLAGKKDTRVVNIVHGYLFDENSSPLRRLFMLGAEKLCAPVTDRILTMNGEDTEIAKNHRLCRGDITQVDGMGIDYTRFAPAAKPEKAAAREALGLPPDAFVLLYAAEFSARKNQSMLLKSLSVLPERVHLLLPGRGGELEACRTLAKTLGIAHRVSMPGFAEDMELYRRAADVCVSASRFEGLPFHVMEAMACALPCVLTDVKGHRDLVTGGETGYLFPYNDEGAFRRHIETLMGDPACTKAMGLRAREVSARYGIDRVLPRLLPLYLERE